VVIALLTGAVLVIGVAISLLLLARDAGKLRHAGANSHHTQHPSGLPR